VHEILNGLEVDHLALEDVDADAKVSKDLTISESGAASILEKLTGTIEL
jgi:hypothetical protein